jgi:hypothetical protein
MHPNKFTPEPRNAKDVAVIRSNRTRLGLDHWFNDYGTEYWRNPITGKSYSFYEWV